MHGGQWSPKSIFQLPFELANFKLDLNQSVAYSTYSSYAIQQ